MLVPRVLRRSQRGYAVAPATVFSATVRPDTGAGRAGGGDDVSDRCASSALPALNGIRPEARDAVCRPFSKKQHQWPPPHEVGNVIVQDGIELSGRTVVTVRGGRLSARNAALRILRGRWRAYFASTLDLESVTGQLTGSALARSRATRACFNVSLPISGSQAQVRTVQLVGGTGRAKYLRMTGTGRVHGLDKQKLSKIRIEGTLLIVRGPRQGIPAGCGSRSL